MATKIIGTSADVTIDGVVIPLLKSAEFSITHNEVETTDNDSSNGWQEFLMGNRTGTFSVTFNWDSALGGSDAEPQEVFPVNLAGTNASLAIIYYPEGNASGNRKYTFAGYPSEFTHGIANETVVECAVTFRVSGSIAVGTVSP